MADWKPGPAPDGWKDAIQDAKAPSLIHMLAYASARLALESGTSNYDELMGDVKALAVELGRRLDGAVALEERVAKLEAMAKPLTVVAPDPLAMVKHLKDAPAGPIVFTPSAPAPVEALNRIASFVALKTAELGASWLSDGGVSMSDIIEVRNWIAVVMRDPLPSLPKIPDSPRFGWCEELERDHRPIFDFVWRENGGMQCHHCGWRVPDSLRAELELAMGKGPVKSSADPVAPEPPYGGRVGSEVQIVPTVCASSRDWCPTLKRNHCGSDLARSASGFLHFCTRCGWSIDEAELLSDPLPPVRESTRDWCSVAKRKHLDSDVRFHGSRTGRCLHCGWSIASMEAMQNPLPVS